LTDQEVVDFSTRFKPPTIPGVPTFNVDNIIDGGRTITIFRPIPPSSVGRRFHLLNKVLGVYDRGKVGSVIEDERVLVDAETGQEYMRMVGLMYYIGQGNWGGPKGQISLTRSQQLFSYIM
jgi:peroxisomal enoyl-CoA hydratase 2